MWGVSFVISVPVRNTSYLLSWYIQTGSPGKELAKPTVTLSGGAHTRIHGVTFYFYSSSVTFGKVASF